LIGAHEKRLGLGALAGADLLQQLIRATALDHERYAIYAMSGLPR
jgi:hypothetical protein